MISPKSGATDVLSSLPIIACCIVSVMILVGTFTHTVAGGTGDPAAEALTVECRRILSIAMGHLTIESQDGRKFIANDWEIRLRTIEFDLEAFPSSSVSIEIRLFNQTPYELALSGNVSECNEVRSSSEPTILIDQGSFIPGEVIVKVGR